VERPFVRLIAAPSPSRIPVIPLAPRAGETVQLPPLDRQMQQASQLELGNPAKAAATWSAIDRQLTNNAIWAPTVSDREVDLVSRRLHNYEYNPVWGFLTDQSWLG